MEYRTLGRTGVQVSPICLGSDDFGDATPPDISEKTIIGALDAGIDLIDTGNLYVEAESEKIIERYSEKTIDDIKSSSQPRWIMRHEREVFFWTNTRLKCHRMCKGTLT